ncbi:MAG: sugar phosphate isomerase/epimerase family protein [Halobacteriaceae archaeon]
MIAGSSLLYTRYDFPEACARLADAGFDAVDVGAIEGWAHVDPSAVVADPDAAAERVGRACERAAVSPVALNAGCGDVTPDEEVRQVAAIAVLADAVGADALTLPAAGVDADVDADLDRFRRLVDATDDADVALTVETHYDTLTEDPEVAGRYAAVSGLGLTLDPSHFAVGPYWDRGYDDLLPAAEHVHLRQSGASWAAVQRPPGDGRVDFDRLFDALAGVGYDGHFSVEYIDSLDGIDPVEAEAAAVGMRELAEEGWCRRGT